jgi:hypothetical protein
MDADSDFGILIMASKVYQVHIICVFSVSPVNKTTKQERINNKQEPIGQLQEVISQWTPQ